jgi:hypothetical protein
MSQHFHLVSGKLLFLIWVYNGAVLSGNRNPVSYQSIERRCFVWQEKFCFLSEYTAMLSCLASEIPLLIWVTTALFCLVSEILPLIWVYNGAVLSGKRNSASYPSIQRCSFVLQAKFRLSKYTVTLFCLAGRILLSECITDVFCLASGMLFLMWLYNSGYLFV